MLETDREPEQSFRRGRARTFDRSAMLDQTFHPAQTGRARENFQARQERKGATEDRREFRNESMPPNALICLLAISCARCVGRPG